MKHVSSVSIKVPNIYIVCAECEVTTTNPLRFILSDYMFILQLPAPFALQHTLPLISSCCIKPIIFSLFCVAQVTSRLVWWRKRVSWRWKSSELEDSYKSQDPNPSLVRTFRYQKATNPLPPSQDISHTLFTLLYDIRFTSRKIQYIHSGCIWIILASGRVPH